MAGAGFGAADADGTWGFKATPDGKVTLGNTSDDVIQVTGSLDINGNIYAAEYIYHVGDTDTYIRLQPDEITIFAGNKSFIKMEEASQDKLVFNNGANDIDFHIKGEGNANLFRTIASANQIGIGTNDPDHLLDVNGELKTNYLIITPTAQDLGSGTTSTLSIGSSLMLLDADSITGTELEPGFDVHMMTVPNGSTHGQKLVLVVEGQFGASDAVGIMLNGTFTGSTPVLMSGTQSAQFVWISTAAVSSWYAV
jgi:hypothetical protein